MVHKNIALYYPTINISSQDWINKSILYWDKISSIVPESDFDYLLPHLKDLRDRGLYVETNPSELIHHESCKAFDKEFKEQITGKILNKKLSKKAFLIHKTKMSNSMVHINKVSNGLFDWLEQNSLARTERDYNGEWYVFEERTALIYMSLLSKYLSLLKTGLVPSTDKLIYQKLGFSPGPSSKGNIDCLRIKLRDILPAPVDVSTDKIIKFKEKHEDEFNNFLNDINEYSLSFRTASAKDELKAILAQYNSVIISEKKKLAKTLKENNISSIFGSLNTIIGSGSGYMFGLLAGTLTTLPAGVISAAGAALGGATALGALTVRNHFSNKGEIRNNAFGYLLEAERHKIIKS